MSRVFKEGQDRRRKSEERDSRNRKKSNRSWMMEMGGEREVSDFPPPVFLTF